MTSFCPNYPCSLIGQSVDHVIKYSALIGWDCHTHIWQSTQLNKAIIFRLFSDNGPTSTGFNCLQISSDQQWVEERVNNEKFVKVILLQNIILLNSILTLSVYHWVSTIIFNLLQGELQFAHFIVVQHKAELRGIGISYFDLKSFILSRPGWFRKLAATAHSYNSPVSTLLSSQVQNNFKMFSRPQSWIVLTPALGDITQTNSTIKLKIVWTNSEQLQR